MGTQGIALFLDTLGWIIAVGWLAYLYVAYKNKILSRSAVIGVLAISVALMVGLMVVVWGVPLPAF